MGGTVSKAEAPTSSPASCPVPESVRKVHDKGVHPTARIFAGTRDGLRGPHLPGGSVAKLIPMGWPQGKPVCGRISSLSSEYAFTSAYSPHREHPLHCRMWRRRRRTQHKMASRAHAHSTTIARASKQETWCRTRSRIPRRPASPHRR